MRLEYPEFGTFRRADLLNFAGASLVIFSREHSQTIETLVLVSLCDQEKRNRWSRTRLGFWPGHSTVMYISSAIAIYSGRVQRRCEKMPQSLGHFFAPSSLGHFFAPSLHSTAINIQSAGYVHDCTVSWSIMVDLILSLVPFHFQEAQDNED